jgi:hypothetical protein
MTDATRPALLGYIAIKDRVTTPAVEHRMRQQLINFAGSEGYTLESIFTETLDTGSTRINSLVTQATVGDPVPTVAVLVGTDVPDTYAKLLADAGIAVLRVPGADDEAEGARP